MLVREALTCQFMDRAANVIVEGCTGTGKSYLACRMAKQACRMLRSARYIRLPDLLMERDELAATERSDAKIPRKHARYELPVIDERLTEDVEDVAIRFLLELVERRHTDRSAVLCTQYSPAGWHGRLGSGVQADAMTGRLVHGAVLDRLGRRQREEAALREEVAIRAREAGDTETAWAPIRKARNMRCSRREIFTAYVDEAETQPGAFRFGQ